MLAREQSADSLKRPAFRFYGRRMGRAPTPAGAQIFAEGTTQFGVPLPTTRLTSLASLFGVESTASQHYTLEIGFGNGEHLVGRAAASPEHFFIGVEAFQDGVIQVYRQCLQRPLQNVRVYDNDVRYLLEKLPLNSFQQIFVLFPDPWPKQRHLQRRLVTPETVAALAPLLTNGGTLFLATDIADYAVQMQESVATVPSLVQTPESLANPLQPFAGHITTKYQRKAHREGRDCVFLSYSRC